MVDINATSHCDVDEKNEDRAESGGSLDALRRSGCIEHADYTENVLIPVSAPRDVSETTAAFVRMRRSAMYLYNSSSTPDADLFITDAAYHRPRCKVYHAL